MTVYSLKQPVPDDRSPAAAPVSKSDRGVMGDRVNAMVPHQRAAAERAPGLTPALIDNRLGAAAQLKLCEAIRSSPRIIAQRKLIESIHQSPRAQRLRVGVAPAAQFVRPSSNGVIQRAPVPVSGGTFDVINHQYLATDSVDGKGAEMNLRFDPDDQVGEDGDTLSLVQTVQDTTQRWDQGQDVTIPPTTSQLGNRTLQHGEPGVRPHDVGTSIDQEVQDNTQIINLDPRYTEKRTDPLQPLELGTSGAKRANAASVRSAEKGQRTPGQWTHAALNDAPNVSTRIAGVPPRVRRATITGGMKFEVAALHNEQQQFLGSVKWGWRMQGANAVLDPQQLTLKDAGSASERFFKAAAKWNRTDIVDPQGGPARSPLLLPVLQRACAPVHAALDAYPRSPYDVSPVQEQAARNLLSTLKNAWNGLQDRERANEAGAVMSVLSRFFMTVDRRLPAQDVMWGEKGFTKP